MKQTVILKNKLFLYLTEVFSGMSVGGRVGSEPSVGTVFQFVADRLDDHYRNHHDRDGTRQYLRRKKCGQVAESGPPVHENPDRCDLDRSDSGGGQIYRARNLGTFDFYGEQSFFDHCSVCSMYGHLCISSFLTGNRDTVACKICGGQSG